MKFNKSLFYILAIFSLVLISGCGEEDCSQKDTTYTKYGWEDQTKTCVIIKNIQKDVCGNNIAEDGETYCNCPKDILKTNPVNGCDGTLGEYLEKSCQKEECVLTQNKKVVEQTKKIHFKNSDLDFQADITFNTPYIVNSYDENSLDIDISLFKLSTSYNIKNIVVKDLSIENSKNILFGSQTYEKQINELGDSLGLKEIELSPITEYDSRESLKLKLVVSYIKETLNSKGEITKTEEKIETLSTPLGYLDIINPDFFEE